MKRLGIVSISIVLLFAICTHTQANAKITYEVPFLCQAPEGIWSKPFSDTCEEAAIIMAVHFIRGEALDKKNGRKEILALVDRQKTIFGGHFDLAAEKSLALIKSFYGNISAELISLNGPQDIVNKLREGDILIVPAAGRVLKNPYFRSPGPVYHYLVVIGFDGEKRSFITNDPGTRRGKGYRYSYDVLFNAIHDWTGDPKTIMLGKKKALIVKK